MASISFERDVIIKNKKKIQEVKLEMQNKDNVFACVKPHIDKDSTKVKEQAKKWFCR